MIFDNSFVDNSFRITKEVHDISRRISVTTMVVVSILEVFMLSYSVVNAGYYGPYLWRYRLFYIVLLTMAVIYIALCIHVKKDPDHRYQILIVANPLFAFIFFGWSLGIVWSDYLVTGGVDAMVFMTFSLIIPLSFYMMPAAYGVIAILADCLMLYLIVDSGGVVGQLINCIFFFIFQLVLGISFMVFKQRLAERIVKEKNNAVIDAITGLPNRRRYEENMKHLREEGAPDHLIYIGLDMNGLKEVNDMLGHNMGDQLIISNAECLRQVFGEKANLYRIGGDEFAMLLTAEPDELQLMLKAYEKQLEDRSVSNGITLSTAYGLAQIEEVPGRDVDELARLADERMYESKTRYYQSKGIDRRKHALNWGDKEAQRRRNDRLR